MGFRLRNLKSGICSQSKVYPQHPSNNIILFHCIRGLHTAANHFHNSFVTIRHSCLRLLLLTQHVWCSLSFLSPISGQKKSNCETTLIRKECYRTNVQREYASLTLDSRETSYKIWHYHANLCTRRNTLQSSIHANTAVRICLSQWRKPS